jgi:hypothetical protein
MIVGHWYCTKERRDNTHRIVGDFSVCNCGYKKRLDARPTKEPKGEDSNPKKVRGKLRSSNVGSTKTNTNRAKGTNRNRLESTPTEIKGVRLLSRR